MATQLQYFLNMSFIDSRKKISNIRWRVDPTAGAAWLTAADAAAKAATPLGLLVTRTNALSDATLTDWGVELAAIDDGAIAPAADGGIYNFDKVTTQFKAGLKNYVTTIPARNDAVLNAATDGTTIIITGAGASAEVTNFITSYNAVVLADNGVAPEVTGMYVAS